MDADLVLLSRLQFAFTVSFHIIFPSFTIGLAGWLAALEVAWTVTGNADYRRVSAFWTKIFAISFGMGVVSGIVMSFEFGTNWSVFAERAGNIIGPLLAYEVTTAFFLEATFLGLMLFGRNRLPPLVYLFCVLMVAIGTCASAFWIMVSNSWMQTPAGFELVNGRFMPTDWWAIIFNPSMAWRFPHMLLAAYITTAIIAGAVGCWFLLRGQSVRQARIMVRMGLGLAAILVPIQLVVGHFNGREVGDNQPIKLAAIEARWEHQEPASLTLIGWPDADEAKTYFAINVPVLGSLFDSDSLTAPEPGLLEWPREDWPPIAIPFFTFRIMVGMGLVMLFVAWYGSYLQWRGRLELERNRWFLWAAVAAFPSGWIAVIAGWFTAEVGRQPWIVYGHLRTIDAHSPLTFTDLQISLALFVLAYGTIFAAGFFYIVRLVLNGPDPDDTPLPEHAGQAVASAKRPLSLVARPDPAE